MLSHPVIKFLRRFYRGNTAAILGTIIVSTVIIMSVFASVIAENDPKKRVARGHQPPSAELLLGSTRSGKDVFSQVLHGGKISLMVAFGAAFITTIIAVAVGVSAGYFGGRVDEFLMFFIRDPLLGGRGGVFLPKILRHEPQPSTSPARSVGSRAEPSVSSGQQNLRVLR